jgi:iron complex outermembrane recepter protein
MSELIQKNDNRATIRWKLLTGVSALALTAYVSLAAVAKAEDSGQPPIWIELGGQFAQQQTSEEVFSPSFLTASPFDAASNVGLEKIPPSSWDGAAKISFEPAGTNWVFSASILLGRNSHGSTLSQETAHASPFAYVYQAYQIFTTRSSESHTVMDFQAGRDVGLGMFGGGGRSTMNFGVRYAQFNSRSSTSIRSQPTNIVAAYGSYHKFYASFDAKRKFTGVGPSLSWDASVDLAGNRSESKLTFDWGLNGAVLFGRQHAQVHHQTTNEKVVYASPVHRTAFGSHFAHFPVSQASASPSRSKRVTVPNLGGFAGVSWRTPNAKISMGYRADMFFGAIDGGIDTAKKEDRGFYGPFLSVAVGIGD